MIGLILRCRPCCQSTSSRNLVTTGPPLPLPRGRCPGTPTRCFRRWLVPGRLTESGGLVSNERSARYWTQREPMPPPITLQWPVPVWALQEPEGAVPKCVQTPFPPRMIEHWGSSPPIGGA